MYIIIHDTEEKFVPCTYPDIIEGMYEISSYGRIYNAETNKIVGTLSKGKNRYVRVKLKTIYGIFKSFSLHRLVAWDFCDGYSENRNQVNHLDNNTEHNYYKNLEWCTKSENERHKHNHSHPNTKPPIHYGEEHPNNAYSIEYIEMLCRYINKYKKPIQVMKKLGYSGQNDNKKLYNLIYDILNKRVWANVSNKYF